MSVAKREAPSVYAVGARLDRFAGNLHPLLTKLANSEGLMTDEKLGGIASQWSNNSGHPTHVPLTKNPASSRSPSRSRSLAILWLDCRSGGVGQSNHQDKTHE
jgi:hypothetical protein